MEKTETGKERTQLSLTHSRFVLAKYGIQVIDSQAKTVQESITLEGAAFRGDCLDYQSGPRAMECKVDGGKLQCDRDSWMHIVWCWLFPCALIENFGAYCCTCCCECISSCFKRMEEHYTLQCCDTMKCCKVEEN